MKGRMRVRKSSRSVLISLKMRRRSVVIHATQSAHELTAESSSQPWFRSDPSNRRLRRNRFR